MIRKGLFFLACLTLLLGLEILGTKSVILTESSTKYLVQQSQKIERRRKVLEYFMGKDYPYPEKEIKINRSLAYGLLFFSGVGFFHSLFVIKDSPKASQEKKH